MSTAPHTPPCHGWRLRVVAVFVYRPTRPGGKTWSIGRQLRIFLREYVKMIVAGVGILLVCCLPTNRDAPEIPPRYGPDAGESSA